VSSFELLHGKEFRSSWVSEETVQLVREAFERGCVSPVADVAVNCLCLAYSLEAFPYESFQASDDRF
jgi:hypothetical protein